MSEPVLVVEGLVKSYGPLRAVDGLSLVAPAGAVTAVLGPNGAGKTTTVEICEGLRRADEGLVRVMGQPAGARGLRHRVGVMPQEAGAYPGARCAEMLRLIASYFADPLDPDALLARLGLTEVARTPFRRLSGGQKQRLSLGMAVVGKPELVFLDEPSAGLDVQARHAAWELVRELAAQGVAVVLTTHAMDEAAALADHVVVVDHGRVLAAGTVAELTRGDGVPTLRFRTVAGLDLEPLRSALPPTSTVVEQAAGSYVVQGEVTPALVASVTTWAAGQGALTEDISVDRRSLEDVFLDLTGRELRT